MPNEDIAQQFAQTAGLALNDFLPKAFAAMKAGAEMCEIELTVRLTNAGQAVKLDTIIDHDVSFGGPERTETPILVEGDGVFGLAPLPDPAQPMEGGPPSEAQATQPAVQIVPPVQAPVEAVRDPFGQLLQPSGRGRLPDEV